MPMCQPGREIPGQGIVTQQLVCEDAWGELWRATHDKHGRVLFVAYTTPAGERFFRESLTSLKRWQTSGPGANDSLSTILQVSDQTAIPYILIQDPGGRTLREWVTADTNEELEPTDVVRWMACWFRAVGAANMLDCVPVGLTPDTIFENPGSERFPWKFVPVLPGARLHGDVMGGGRYSAPLLREFTTPSMHHPDTNTLVWIAAECMTHDFNLARTHESFLAAVPLPNLSILLENGVADEAGKYPAASYMEQQLVKWFKDQAEAEMKPWRKKRDKDRKKRGLPPLAARPLAPQSGGGTTRVTRPSSGRARPSGNSGGLIVSVLVGFLKISITLGAFAGGAYGGWWAVKKLFTKTYTTKTAEGAAYFYGEGLAKKDFNAAMGHTTGNDIERSTREISGYLTNKQTGKVSAVMEGHGTEYVGLVEIQDPGGKIVAVITVKARKEGEDFKIFYAKATGGEFLDFIGLQ